MGNPKDDDGRYSRAQQRISKLEEIAPYAAQRDKEEYEREIKRLRKFKSCLTTPIK